MNLLQKLAKIRAIADVVAKDKKGYNYKYSDITEILAKITAGMKKYDVSLIPTIVPGTSSVEQRTIVETKTDKTGKPFEKTSTEQLVTADMVFRWVDDENPNDCIEVPWFLTGSQSDPSQAFGSGLTYCTRYFLCNYFQIAQTDQDVDSYRSKQKAAEEAENHAIAEAIIEEFDTLARQYFADHPDQSDKLTKFIARFSKSGKYKSIKDPALAGKLLTDFKEQFLKETT